MGMKDEMSDNEIVDSIINQNLSVRKDANV